MYHFSLGSEHHMSYKKRMLYHALSPGLGILSLNKARLLKDNGHVYALNVHSVKHAKYFPRKLNCSNLKTFVKRPGGRTMYVLTG